MMTMRVLHALRNVAIKKIVCHRIFVASYVAVPRGTPRGIYKPSTPVVLRIACHTNRRVLVLVPKRRAQL